MTKSWAMRYARHVELIRKKRSVYKILTGKPEENRQPRIPRMRLY
jgi:hypothetical protein